MCLSCLNLCDAFLVLICQCIAHKLGRMKYFLLITQNDFYINYIGFDQIPTSHVTQKKKNYNKKEKQKQKKRVQSHVTCG